MLSLPPADLQPRVADRGHIPGLPGHGHVDWEVVRLGDLVRLRCHTDSPRLGKGWADLSISVVGPDARVQLVTRRDGEDNEMISGRWRLDPECRRCEPAKKLISWLLGYLMEGTQPCGSQERGLEGAIEDAILTAVAEVLRPIPAELLAIARTFPVRVCQTVLGLMLEGGLYVQQMGRVCPSLLNLIVQLRGRGDEEGSTRLLSLIEEGRPLADILALANDYVDLVAGEPEGPSRSHQRLRVALWRKAPAQVGVPALVLRDGAGLQVEDIPQELDARIRFYRLLEDVARRALFRRLSADDRAAFMGYLGRHHHHVICPDDDEEHEGSLNYRALLHYAARSGDKVPSRHQSPDAVARRLDTWHERTWRRSALPEGTEFPRWTGPLPQVEAFHLRQLATVDELRTEGRLMRHCVATYEQEAVKGELYLFHGVAMGEEFTLAVASRSGGYRIVEVAKKENRRIAPGVRRTLVEWLKRQPAPAGTEAQTGQ